MEYDVKATVVFDGEVKLKGRKWLGYPLQFSGFTNYFDGRLYVDESVELIPAGRPFDVQIKFLSPESIRSVLKIGTQFGIWERGTVGRGEITQVLRSEEAGGAGTMFIYDFHSKGHAPGAHPTSTSFRSFAEAHRQMVSDVQSGDVIPVAIRHGNSVIWDNQKGDSTGILDGGPYKCPQCKTEYPPEEVMDLLFTPGMAGGVQAQVVGHGIEGTSYFVYCPKCKAAIDLPRPK